MTEFIRRQEEILSDRFAVLENCPKAATTQKEKTSRSDLLGEKGSPLHSIKNSLFQGNNLKFLIKFLNLDRIQWTVESSKRLILMFLAHWVLKNGEK